MYLKFRGCLCRINLLIIITFALFSIIDIVNSSASMSKVLH